MEEKDKGKTFIVLGLLLLVGLIPLIRSKQQIEEVDGEITSIEFKEKN